MSNDVLGGTCSLMGSTLKSPGNPIPLMLWCSNINAGEGLLKAPKIAVWCFLYSIIAMIINCIVLAIWLADLGYNYGTGGMYAGFIWPVFVAFLWTFIAMLLCVMKNQLGLLIFAIIQACWTCWGIWHCIEYLVWIGTFDSLGYSGGGVWFVMFAVYIPAVFLSAALTFWVYRASTECAAGGSGGGSGGNKEATSSPA